MKGSIDRWRKPLSSRAVVAGVLTAAVLGALALVGGLGHASIGSTATSAAQYQYNPTSKDQCRRDGWRNFPQFNNQTQCLSFFAKSRLS